MLLASRVKPHSGDTVVIGRTVQNSKKKTVVISRTVQNSLKKTVVIGRVQNSLKKIGLTWGHFSDGDNEVFFIVQ